MKAKSFVVLFLLLVLVLTACQSATPAPLATDPVAPPQEQQQEPEDTPYPSPGEQVVQAPAASVLYPGAQDGDTVEWDQARSMILNGEAAQVVHSSSRDFTLILKDGRSFISREPADGQLLVIIENCGERCSDIEIITE